MKAYRTKLPYYCEVEYIESTGTQYIDTGVYLTNNHTVEIDYQLTQAQQSRGGIFGLLNGGTNKPRFGTLTSPSNYNLEMGYGSSNAYYQLGVPDTNRHTLKQAKNKAYFDGVLVKTFNTATFTMTVTAPLGNFTYTNYTPAKAKYYSSKWWDNDTLVRDFIPVKDWNDVPCMYDKVSGQLFYNQGTGQFTAGREIHPVEYLESTGTQYIDTGIVPANNNVYAFKGECTQNASGARTVFGSSNTNNTASINASLYNSGANSRWGTSTVQNMYATPLETHTCEVSKNGYTVDGQTSAFASGSFTGTSTNKIVVFGNRSANGTVTPSKIKLWYFQIKQGGILVRDFIPAVDENGIAFMYDRVDGVIYDNAGTGSFVIGTRQPETLVYKVLLNNGDYQGFNI